MSSGQDTLNRPIQLLYLLEVYDSEDSDGISNSNTGEEMAMTALVTNQNLTHILPLIRATVPMFSKTSLLASSSNDQRPVHIEQLCKL